jgi:methylenetetrahydrofolate reductase (NADPH)
MLIKDLFTSGQPLVSFEFFPPKTDEATAELYKTITELKSLRPSYVSVTYGAGGSTRDRTVDLVIRIQKELGITAMAHLTCVGSTKEEIHQVLGRLHEGGIRNILALRGDPPKGETTFKKIEGGFGYASELVGFMRGEKLPFCLGGACYPEGHVETRDLERDLANLQKKVAAGVDFLVTQLFFRNNDYFTFVRRARKAGITLPIVPGIMPISNVDQIKRFTTMCGASIPAPLLARLEPVKDDHQKVVEIGIEHAATQCRELLAGGAPGIHFYTLNKSPASRAVYERLQLRR